MLADSVQLSHRVHDLGGVKLYAVEAGPPDGPLVILLHGFPEFSYGWRHQIGPLAAAGFRIVVPDQRGYGQSDKPEGIEAYRLPTLAADVLKLADLYRRPRFSLVGHDWGGIVAWYVAGTHPERVERLAILNAPHPDLGWRYVVRRPAQLLRSFYVALFQLSGLPEKMLAWRDYRLLRDALVRTSWPGTFREEDIAVYRMAWAKPGALTAMLNWYRALIRLPAGPAGRIKVPARILWGKRDRALGSSFATDSLALCDNGRITWFDDATHWLPHEEPKAISADLISFLQT